MFYRYRLLLILLLAGVARLGAQEFNPEDICVAFGSGVITNVLTDDVPPGGDVVLETDPFESQCLLVDRLGNLSFSPFAEESFCCGPQPRIILTVYQVLSDGNREPIGQQIVEVDIKCIKPDCGLVDLEAIEQPVQDPTNDLPPPPNCVSACENSTATYLFNQVTGFTYDWQAVNGNIVDPGVPGQIMVEWGPLGGASLSVDIYDNTGAFVETRTWCVELTPSPVADFTATSVACLDQEVFFTNTSSGAPATYDWDFGDGNTAQNVTNPSHTYTTAGTYTVTLFATSSSTDTLGNEGCCCTDSVSYDIVIDPLPGPPIYWISTLCEGDQSEYWTDVTGCSSIVWTVSGNGNIVSGQGTDRIVVDWGTGPSGTITLAVTDCDVDYCPQPSTAVVPIISANGDIAGPTEVCKGATATYELPKWQTVEYSWSSSDPAVNINGDGHIVSVTWPTTPGDYEITVNYGSDFLAGLPGHAGDDCTGSATLTVTVLGDFYVAATPNPACLGDATFLQGFSDIGPTSYNWTVAGNPGLSSTGPTASILWPAAGVYTVTADVVNPNDYCVASRSVTVVVEDAVDPVITGPTDYCVGDPIVYNVLSPTPGYDYNWSITGGTILAGDGGPTVTVAFSVTTGAVLTVVGMDSGAPNCTSAPASVFPVTKDFVGSPVITGDAACTNSTAMYGISIPQHPDATYTWSVDPVTDGSVTAGGDTPNPTVTWNNDPGSPTLTVVIELCGQTLTLDQTLNLTAPTPPVITQVGELCPSGTADLEVDGTLFSSISWSTGETAASIEIDEPGDYVVNTIDNNGCPGVAQITVEEVDGPEVTITVTGQREICVNSPPFPPNPTLTATTAGGNTVQWLLDGSPLGAPVTGSNSIIHTWTTDVMAFGYSVLVTDPNGCTTQTDPVFIRQELCCDTPFVSDPLAQFHTFTATNQTPDCSIVDLTASWSLDSVDCHLWEVPRFTTILGGSGDTIGNIATDNLTIRLPGVGCYKVESGIYNWAYDYDTTTVINPATGLPEDIITIEDSIKCGDILMRTVCNPLFAEFDYSEDCDKVSFLNESQVDLTLTAGPVTYSWDFDDMGATSTDENPMHTFSANGTYNVTLVVSDGTCQSTFVLPVEVTNVPDTDFTFSPDPACVGQPVSFTGTGTDIIQWTWDFGDDAQFVGADPDHAYVAAGTYTVTLTTLNSSGCEVTVTGVINVNPVPADQTITASNGLIICDGDNTTLSVPFVAGNTYEWNTTATGNSITVSTAGTYGLTITNADGCETIVDAVEVQLIPLPDGSYSGDLYICDQGATTLTAAAGGGHTYEWTNVTTGATGMNREFTVFYFAGPPEQDIILKVTNDYGCVVETAITVFQVASPSPNVVVTGGTCEGDGSTITVTNPEPDVVYTWNTGETGLSIFTYQAGGYTVIATNTVTGCTGTALAVINPLPDLCIMPTGCYETCGPDTLQAPIGAYTYMWFFEGGMIPGESGSSLIVDITGEYTVKVTDIVTGCFSVSDPLNLEIIDCDSTSCDDLITRLAFTPTSTGECCYELNYSNLPAGVYGIRISTTDAELTATAVNPALGYVGSPDDFTLEFAIDATLTNELPVNMTGPGVATFCPSAITNTPQLILIEYLDAEGNTVCEDEIQTECEPEPECLFVATDSLFCDDDGNLTLTMTVCVPAGLDFSVGHIDLLASPAAALDGLPNDFNFSPAIAPGECRDLTFLLNELPPGEEFCYTLTAHTGDPDEDPTALCCSEGIERCLIVPDCDPCDDLIVEGVIPVGEDGDCCYDIYLYDGATDQDFDQIDLCLLGGDATLSLNTVLGAALTGTVNTTGTMASIFSPSGAPLPDGEVFQLPRLCLDGGDQSEYLLEIKWLNEDEILCRDTISLFCEPDCGYLVDGSADCANDRYVWSGTIVNNSGFPVSEADIVFPVGSGLEGYNTTIDFGGPVPDGGSTFISFDIGQPAGPGDTICFTIALHETNDGDNHLNCCNFEACIVLPDCQIDGCDCETLAEEVALGIDTFHVGPGPRDYLIFPVAPLTNCDEVFYWVRALNPNTPWENISSGTYSTTYTFALDRRYRVDMRVLRTLPDGTQCLVQGVSSFFDFRPEAVVALPTDQLEAFPNPAGDEIVLRAGAGTTIQLDGAILLLDVNGKRIRNFGRQPAAGSGWRVLDLNDLRPGVYLLRGESSDGSWTKRFIKQ